MGKEKTKKNVVSMKGKKTVTAEEKATMKAAMKTLKAAKDEALKTGDKKQIHAVRLKLKKARGKLRHAFVPAAPKAEATA